MKNRCGKIIARTIVVSVLSVIVSYGFVWFAPRVVENLVGVDDDSYLRYYYNFVNSNFREIEASESLVLVDIANCNGRIEIAGAISSIIAYKPKVLVLDVFFADNPDIRGEVNDSLSRVLAEREIFMPSLDSSRRLRLVNYTSVEGLRDTLQLDSCRGFRVVNDGFFRNVDSSGVEGQLNLSQAVARAYLGNLSYRCPFHFNYVRKYFYKCNIEELKLDIEDQPDYLRDKIVFVGDFEDMRDWKYVPFKIKSGGADDFSYISGVEKLVYETNTWLHIGNERRNTGWKYAMANMPLYDMRWQCDVLLSFVLTILYFVLTCLALSRIQLSRTAFGRIVWFLIRFMMLLVYEAVVVLIAFLVTAKFGYIPDLMLLMCSVFIVHNFVELIWLM